MIFSQPQMLWGLLAVAIPIVVHLFNFRRYRKVYFSNVERLQELVVEQRRHRDVRRWLVLAVRVLAIVGLVLAFAQPIIPQKKGNVQQGAAAVSIYVDNSFSMEQADGEGSVLEKARRSAREVADAYAATDRFQLITNDQKGSEMRWLSKEEFIEQLAAVQPSPATQNISSVCERQQRFMRQSGARNCQSYIISDFQRSTSDVEALPTDSVMQFTLVPLEGIPTDNVYVDTVRLDAPAYQVGASVGIEVVVANDGDHTAEGVPLRLDVGGRERTVSTLDIPPHSSTTAHLRFTIEQAGWVDATVSLEDYPITFDNSYFFTFESGRPLQMLVLDETASGTAIEKLFAGDTLVRCQTAPRLQHDLSQVNFLVLNESSSLTSGDAMQVAEWVQEGGSLLLVPAAQGKGIEDVNNLLSMLGAPQMGAWTANSLRAGKVDFEARLYAGVFSSTTNDVELPTVRGFYAMNGQATVMQTLIALSDGSPWLTLTPVGEGSVYLFASPLKAEWTDFVAQALFVPTLYNMALYSRPLPAVAHTLGSETAIPLIGDYSAEEVPPMLGDVIPDVRRQGKRSMLLLHGAITTPGLYTLGEEHIAFNLSRKESQLAFLSRSEVEQAIAGRAEYNLMANTSHSLTDQIRESKDGHPLWRWCLVFALLMLVCETLLIKLNR